MKSALKLAVLFCAIPLLAACAGGDTSGVGINGKQLSSLEPTSRIGKGPLTPKSLLGVAPSALAIRLGAPDFKRAEPDAEVWQYSGGDCALFVYFYKAGTGELASTYVDARKTLGGPADTAACLSDVARRKSAAVS
tara:strand:+ start:77164 stop:77571 length:408 start_codon:yes stop_codon:yes gene_type:complete